jgi:adenylate cyclase
MTNLLAMTQNVQQAIRRNDIEAILTSASELDAWGTPQAEALAHDGRGWVCYLRGDYPAALAHYHQAISLHTEHHNTIGLARVTGNIGTVFMVTGDYPTSLEYYDRAMSLYEEIGDLDGVARVEGNVGNVYCSMGNFPAALEHMHHALALNIEIGQQGGVANDLCNLGNVHGSTGDFPAALEHYHRAQAILEEVGDRLGIANVTGNIGIVHMHTGNYAAAIDDYHRAISFHSELGNRSGVANVTSNLGSVYFMRGDYPAALEKFRDACSMYTELGITSGIATATGNMLETHLAMNALADALALLETLDAMPLRDPEFLIIRENGRALLMQKSERIDEAVTVVRGILSTALEHGLRMQAAEAHKQLRDLAQQRNDFAGYIEHNNEYTRITEEINGKDTATKLAMQAKQREIDAKDREHQKHLAVLHSTLPKHVADRVARGEVVNDHFESASVIFLDIVGFTALSSDMSSQEVITLLEDVFTQCDAICAKHGVTKIKTIGDSYMCVAFDSVTNAALCALDMSRIRISHEVSHAVSHEVPDVSHEVEFRIGIHCGPVTAGVIGKERMQYDVWGDTVNVASRMESSGEAGRVHVSEAFANNLKINQESRIKNPISESHEVSLVTGHSSLVTSLMSLVTIERGSMDIKGKGLMRTYWLETTSS